MKRGALLVVVLALSGCQSREGEGDAPAFSADSNYLVSVRSFARFRYDYVEREASPKALFVDVTRTGACRFGSEYTVIGWDVSWRIRWTSDVDAVVEVFDYGPDIDHRGGRGVKAAERHLRDIRLHIDEASGRVAEQ